MPPIVTPIFPRNNGPIYRPTHTTPEIPSSTPNTLNCITIAQHIDNCPICSRLYDTDKTLYILAIIGLLILCFLMVKHIVKI